MLRRILFALPVAALLLLAGCGDITHQTRFIPTSDEIGWGPELYELPWQDPSLGEQHKPRPRIDTDAEQSFIVREYPDRLFDMRTSPQGHE